MKCPKCSKKARVVKVVHEENGDIIRCQKCDQCGYIFYTEETYEEKMQNALKKDLSTISYENLKKSILRRNGVQVDD